MIRHRQRMTLLNGCLMNKIRRPESGPERGQRTPVHYWRPLFIGTDEKGLQTGMTQ